MSTDLTTEQDCIPVGCVPPACWPYPSMHCADRRCTYRGGVPARGCTCLGDVPAQGCTCLGGVPARGVYVLGGVPARGVYTWGCTCLGGVPAQGGVYVLGVYPNMQWGRHPPPPNPPWTESQTPVKTFPQLRLRAVKIRWEKKNPVPSQAHSCSGPLIPSVKVWDCVIGVDAENGPTRILSAY